MAFHIAGASDRGRARLLISPAKVNLILINIARILSNPRGGGSAIRRGEDAFILRPLLVDCFSPRSSRFGRSESENFPHPHPTQFSLPLSTCGKQEEDSRVRRDSLDFQRITGADQLHADETAESY